jgi:hypothetical protein
MAEIIRQKPREYMSHAKCSHENTEANRKLCRLGRLHDGCDHGLTAQEKAWCTRRKNDVQRAREKE